MTATLIVLAITVTLFIIGKIRSDIVALCALTTLILLGILTPEEALSGFSSSVVIIAGTAPADRPDIRKARIGSYTKYETVKCSLIFRVPEGTRKVRLYGFGEKDLEILLNAMRDAKVRRMTVEEKAEVKAK